MDDEAFSQQTSDILLYFFEDTGFETDSSSEEDDAVRIAAQLRQLGDHYDETVIQPLVRDIQQAAVDKAAVAFTQSVDHLCKMWVAQSPEVVPEKHLLKATMALSLYMKRNCPDLKKQVYDAAFNIVINRLGGWIREQGGWERVSSLRE